MKAGVEKIIINIDINLNLHKERLEDEFNGFDLNLKMVFWLNTHLVWSTYGENLVLLLLFMSIWEFLF